ncbi:hypothetical protein Trydic_g13827 [Trypoxylus dichotomus]
MTSVIDFRRKSIVIITGASQVEEPNINILTYSPGPVNTAMFNEVIKNAQSAELKTQFKDIKTNNIILSTEQTVEKLLKILESGKYKSGGVIDYFDEM